MPLADIRTIPYPDYIQYMAEARIQPYGRTWQMWMMAYLLTQLARLLHYYFRGPKASIQSPWKMKDFWHDFNEKGVTKAERKTAMQIKAVSMAHAPKTNK